MFGKKEFFVGMVVSLIAGIGIGYSKAREKFMEALLKVTASCDKKEEEES